MVAASLSLSADPALSVLSLGWQRKVFFEVDSWPQKQQGRSARRMDYQTDFLSLSLHTRASSKNATGASTGGVYPKASYPVSMKVILEPLCFLQCGPSLLAQQEVWHSPSSSVCQPLYLSVQRLGAEGNPHLSLYGMGKVCLPFSQLPRSGLSCSIIHFPILPRA